MSQNLINDVYYQLNPNNILGEAYQQSSRYGLTTRYKGDVMEALQRINSSCPNYNIKSSSNVSIKNTGVVLGKVLSQQQRNNALDALKQAAPSLVLRMQAKQRERMNDVEILTFDDIDTTYNAHLSDAQKCAFVYYMNNTLGRKLRGGWQKYDIDLRAAHGEIDKAKTIQQYVLDGILCYDGESYMPAFIFASGDVFAREAKLEKNKSHIVNMYGEDTYERQLAILQRATTRLDENRLRLDSNDPHTRLRVLVDDAISKQYQIKTLEDGEPFYGRYRKTDSGAIRISFEQASTGARVFESLSLQEAFIYWLKKGVNTPIRYGVSWKDIWEHSIKRRSRSPSENEADFKRKKKMVLEEAQRLFVIFLANIIKQEDRDKIEMDWNQMYQSDVPIDYHQVPIGFSVAKFYNSFPMDIRDEKREAVAAAMIQGSLCISYGVGLGKTWCAIFAMAQFIENGWAKRPLLAVPKQVYAQFSKEIAGILPYLQINELGNLSKSYLNNLNVDSDGKLPEKSISIVTFQGLKRIGLSDNVSNALLLRIDHILNQQQEESSERQQAIKAKRNEGILGRIMRDTAVNVDTLGLDMIVLDEAHAAKKIFVTVKGETPEDGEGKRGRTKYEIQAGTPSAMGIKTFALCQYVQSISSGNVLLLTATPFTNSPLEVFSMLALLAYNTLHQRKISNLNDFFDKFVFIENQLVITARLDFEWKDVFAGFADLQGLQTLIRRFFLYKQSTKNLERPNKWVLPLGEQHIDDAVIKGKSDDTTLPMTAIQTAMLKIAQTYVDGNPKAVEKFKLDYQSEPNIFKNFSTALSYLEDANSTDFGVRLLQGVGMSRALALSPYLFAYKYWFKLPKLNYKNYINQSPKLLYTMQCIASVKKAHEKKGEPVSGQIIYMNVGVEYFDLIKEYLVKEIGFAAHEVGIIAGTMPPLEDKAVVQDKFLGRKFNTKTNEYETIPDEYRVKVLIGSSSITEGINLQTHCTVIYNLFLAWNPTDIVQLEGRGWRQGNLYRNIRIVYPLMENSIDSFMFQKQGEKTQRINQIWDFDGNVSQIDLREFNPSELKYQLVTDPARVAYLEGTEKLELQKEQKLVLVTDKSLFEQMRTRLAEVEKLRLFYDKVVELNNKLAENGLNTLALPHKEEFEQFSVVQLCKWAIKLKKKYTNAIDALNDALNPQTEIDASDDDDYPAPQQPAIKIANELEGISRIVQFERFVNRIMLPRRVEVSQEGFDKIISELADAISEMEKNNPLEDANLAARASEIEEERRLRNIKSATVQERVSEFKKLNYLLFEKRIANNNCEFGKGSSTIKYAIGESVKVRQDDDTNKLAKIIAISERVRCAPMYRIEYSGGYQNMAFESDFISTAKEIAFVKKLYLNSLKRQQKIYELRSIIRR